MTIYESIHDGMVQRRYREYYVDSSGTMYDNGNGNGNLGNGNPGNGNPGNPSSQKTRRNFGENCRFSVEVCMSLPHIMTTDYWIKFKLNRTQILDILNSVPFELVCLLSILYDIHPPASCIKITSSDVTSVVFGKGNIIQRIVDTYFSDSILLSKEQERENEKEKEKEQEKRGTKRKREEEQPTVPIRSCPEHEFRSLLNSIPHHTYKDGNTYSATSLVFTKTYEIGNQVYIPLFSQNKNDTTYIIMARTVSASTYEHVKRIKNTVPISMPRDAIIRIENEDGVFGSECSESVVTITDDRFIMEISDH